MRNWKQRLLSLLLCAAVLVSLCPTALAEDGAILYLGEKGEEKFCKVHATVTENDAEWNGGWYMAQGPVAIAERVTLIGNVHLILTDGCELKAAKGINVGEGNSLTIYGQATGTGTLNATGGVRAAGIGGGDGVDGGTITINGGKVTAGGAGGTDIVGGRS